MKARGFCQVCGEIVDLVQRNPTDIEFDLQIKENVVVIGEHFDPHGDLCDGSYALPDLIPIVNC
jgi:hypothetical protein